MAEFLNTIEVADKLGVAEATLRGWRVVGKGPKYVKCGRWVRYSEKTIANWIESQTVTTDDME
ncbi:MAG: helix-turn-helix domain-containing protein [Lentisphaerae bacterium]|nr:helix-turn-helix domain-containing protein [Lentisphaerota bacterium]